MTNEEKAREISQIGEGFYDKLMIDAAMTMAEWKDSQPQVIEIFGKRLKIVKGDRTGLDCMKCAFCELCT